MITALHATAIDIKCSYLAVRHVTTVLTCWW
jgi:hypothetical protein